MIFTLPFWVSSIVISLIKIILSGVVGAIFAFYARHSHDRYANSIRWSRIGGLFETVPLLWYSRRQVPKQSSIAMGSMIFAGLFNLFVTISLSALVFRAESPVELPPIGVFTKQLQSADATYRLDWTTFMESDANMKDTLILMLSDTRSLPNPSPFTVYEPRTYDYEVVCNETAAAVSQDTLNMTFSYQTTSKGCKTTWATISQDVGINWDVDKASSQLFSSGIYIVVAPAHYPMDYLFQPEPLVIGSENELCSSNSHSTSPMFLTFPKDGITALPRTDMTRCHYGSEVSIVLASTQIMFAINQLKDFDKVATSIFTDSTNLPLLASMSTTINSGTFINPTNNATLVMFTRVSTNADFLVCASTFLNRTGDMGLLCTYVLTSVMTIKPQPWDSIISTDLKWPPSPLFEDDSIVSELDLSIQHTPSGSQSSMSSFSAAHLIKGTTDATEYLASLGHNVVVNNKSGQLYILFDTIEFKDAFEVPTPLLIVLVVIVVACLAIWIASEVLYKPVFNGSLYKVIYQEMFMDFQDDFLAFEVDQEAPLDVDEEPGRPSQE